MSYCGSWGWGWGSRYGNYWGRSHYHHRRYDKVDARNDTVTVDEDGSATINVLDNDTSRKGKALHVEQFAGVWAGRTTTVESSDGRSATVTLNRDGTLTVEPGDDFNDLNAGETDTVTIWYKVSNGRGKSDWAKVTITVEGENEEVVIELTNDAVSTGEAEDVTINVLDNDSGAEAVTSVSFGGETFEIGQSFTVTSADGRTGTVTVEADGTLTFTGDGNFEDLNDGETDTVTVTYTVGGEGTPARVIDFEGLSRGEVVSDQFDGVTITAQRRWQGENSPNDAMIFDSNNPTGGDWDLRTSTQDNILIISENNNSWNPDDNRYGGTITFDFDEAENVDALTFIDTERAATVRLTQEDGNVVTLHGPVTANGGVATLSIGVTSVVLMEVILAGSGAIDDLELGAKAGDAQTAEVVITIEGEGSPLAIEDDAFNLFENDSLNGNILDNDIAEGDLIVSSFSGLAAGETAEVTSADGRTGFITVGEDGSISFTADGDFETLAVGDSDTITFSYTAATVGGTGENLIINGDFESNPLNNSGWTAVESIQGWSSPVGHVEIQESNFGTGNTQGNAVVELDAHFNSTIEQTVSVTDAGTYTLSVDYATRGSNFGTNGFDVIVNGEVVSAVRPTQTGFQTESVEVELAAGDAVIQFRAAGTSDSFGTVIDNVELRSTTTSEDVGNATVTIVVDGVNDGPVAADDTASGTEADDGSFAAVTGNVLTNDSDVDLGDVLSVVSADGVAAGQVINVTSDVNGFAGTAVIDADGSLTVTPGADFAALNNGESDTITITYVIEDGNGGTDEAEVVVTINGAGEAFEIVDDSANVLENETLTDNVLDNDNANEGLQVYSFAGVDAGETVTVVSAGGGSGSVTLNEDGSLTFTADGDFESLAAGDTDTVTFTYAAGTGTPRGENLIENGDFESNPLANTGSTIVDAIDSWEATVGNVEVQESDHGSGSAEGNAVVELDANFNSTIAQTVSIAEAGDYVFSLDYAMTGSDAATNGLGVRINGVEVATEFPTTAGFQTLEVNVALAAGDAQIEIFALGDSDGVGTVIDNVALQTAGVAGQQGSAEVTIVVDGVNDGPVALDDADSTNENIDGTISDVVGNVLTNDSDVDAGDLLTVTAVNGVAGNVGQLLNVTSDQGGFAATAVIGADGTITVSPSDEFAALGGGQADTITLTYEVSDGNGGVDEAEVVITVNGADNGVAVNDDAVSVFENSAEFINVLANDTGGQGFAVESVEGNPAGQSFLATTVGGRELQVILLPNGTLTVAANEQFDSLAFGELDTVRLAYTAGDNSGSSAEAFVDVTIIGVNDDIRVFVDEDEPIEVNQGGVGSGQVFIVDANGERGNVDIDGDAASFSIVSQGAFVTATIDEATGEFTFTNEAFGFVGEDSFQFGASDGLSFDSGTVRVEVINVGNAPTFDAAASDLAVDASALGGFLIASGTLTAFDADDFDFTADGTQFPDDILDVEVRQGFTIEMGAGGDEEIAGLVEEIFGELADGAFFIGGVDAVTREADFNFSLDAEEFVGVILDEGLGALELAGISFDLTYTVDINDQTGRDGFTDVTISVGTEDILGLLA